MAFFYFQWTLTMYKWIDHKSVITIQALALVFSWKHLFFWVKTKFLPKIVNLAPNKDDFSEHCIFQVISTAARIYRYTDTADSISCIAVTVHRLTGFSPSRNPGASTAHTKYMYIGILKFWDFSSIPQGPNMGPIPNWKKSSFFPNLINKIPNQSFLKYRRSRKYFKWGPRGIVLNF